MMRTENPPGVRAILLASAMCTLLLLAATTDEWRELELKVFDFLVVLTATAKTEHPITIVGIDDPSMLELEQQWPWPRGTHARLIEALHRAGTAVIAFDILFAEPSSPDEDKELETAIRSAGNVVLAGDLVYQEDDHFQQLIRVEPLEIFLEAGATTGISGLEIDGDLTVRRAPMMADTFWRRVVTAYAASRHGTDNVSTIPPESRIRYLGPKHTFPYVSYYQALAPEKFLPPDTFEGRIVLVGFDLRTSPEPESTQTDLFATPFLSYTGQLSPGVEIQANLVANALEARGIGEVSTTIILGLTLVVVLIFLLGLRDWRPLRGALLTFGLVAVTGVGAWWLFAARDTWLPVLAPWSAAVGMYLIQGGMAFLEERRRKQEIQKAFGYYVSPQVVDELMAHPEKLVLGGECRKLTLMFTDLAGFTTLAEEMSPEQVAEYLNQHMSSMTVVIQRHGGTIPKFIGDGIFALWGAPVEDPEQAFHACQAALEMHETNEKLRETRRGSFLPATTMRIGVHTGPAVVGNMGSTDRFDYTALGDAVNLASRLEGVNKLYGTAILLSEDTASELEGRILLRPVDRVRVKGKALPVELFTPCHDDELRRRSEEAIAAYRRQQWDRAETQWRQLIERFPDDSIAPVYLERVAKFRQSPPADPWDGAVSLEKKI